MPLTPKVYEVLQLLVQNSGHMLGKDELLKAVWPDSFVEEGNLTRNISTLRAALGENSNDHRYIETVPKRGYRFIAGVREFQAESAESLLADGSSARITTEETEVLSSQGAIETIHEPTLRAGEVPNSGSRDYIFSKIKNHTWSTLLCLATLAIAVAALTYYSYFANRGEAIDSVAVMPFANVSGDPATEYLSDGLSDDVISSLAQLPNLKVIAFSRVLRYKGKQTDPQAVGRELDVRAVLMSRLVQRGDDLAISTELVDVRDNHVLWRQQYNRKLADILSVKMEIAQHISEGLRLRLGGDEKNQLAKRYTENPEAFQAYLQGRFFLESGTNAGHQKAIEYFEQAIKKDPAYAPAYIGLARDYRDYLSLSSKDAREKAKPLLLKALEIDDTLAEAHAMLGAIRQDEDDWPAAEKEFERAMDLNPRAWGVHSLYAKYLAAIGRNDEAVAEAKRMLEIDPLSASAVGAVALMSLQARQYDQAIEFFRKAIDMQPNDPRFHNNLARAFVQKGMYEEAIAEFQKANTLDPKQPGRFARFAYTYAVSGKRAQAQKMLEELKEQAKQSHVAPVNFAIIYAGLSEKDRAFEWLEKAYEDRSGPPYIQIDIFLDSLRSDPRFADLARRKGLAL